MALTINFNGLTDLQWQAIFEFLNRYLVPNIVKEPGSPRGQIFNAYLEQINLVATGQLGIEDFLFNIGDIFPVAGEDNDRFRELAEQTQYNGFLKEFEEILASEDPASAIQGLFDRYENVGIADNSIILNELDSFGGINSFNMASADQIFERMILGDNQWGAYVKICSTTVTTNCVNPTAIKDIWEDFGRHIRVIFKGLQIPGLPEWLPLPGIISLPTIGEIWDRVSGTWNEEVDRQIDECLDEDADGDGTYDNTYDECVERINPAGVIMGGIGNAVEEIYKETSQKIKDIVEKDLEVPCVEDLEACAEKTKQVIGDIFGGVWDSADPTMPGIPDWVRLIIIAGEYGDDFIKILEGQTNSDINGDGVIGITTTQVTCWDGSVVDKEEDCPEDTRVDCWDGSKADSLEQCPVDTRNGAGAEDCNKLGRVHVPDQSNQTKGSCGACSDNVNTVPEDENDPMSPCVAPDNPNLNEGDDCATGAPLNAEGTVGPAPDFECVPNEGTTCTDPETGKDGNIENGLCVSQTEPPETTQVDCTKPRPTGEFTFELENQQVLWDQKCRATHCESGVPIENDPDCYGSPPGKTCDNNAVNPDNCDQCENGEHPDAHVDSDCSQPLKAQDGNPGDACTLYDDTVGVVDKNGDCKRVGQNCNRSKYGYTSSDNCDTGLGFNTSSGIIDSSGDCVCNTACADPNREVYSTTGACRDTCKKGWKKDAEGNCTVEDTVAEPCSDENRQKNNDGSCGENCNSGFDQPEGYEVCTSIQQLCSDGAEGYGPDNELCGTTNGCPEGQKKFDGTNCDDPCPDNTDIGASDPLCGATPPETCDNDAVNYPDCNQCPKGKILYNGKCVVPTAAPCDEQNRVTNSDGTCGECKEGYTFDTNQDLCVRDLEECTNGATDYPACTTCPAGKSMDTEGNCVTTTETCANGATDYPACTTCPEGQSMDENGACVGDGDGGGTTGGGGIARGGGGMFDIKPITISGDPQLLSRTEFPITDFLAGLFTGSGGGRA